MAWGSFSAVSQTYPGYPYPFALSHFVSPPYLVPPGVSPGPALPTLNNYNIDFGFGFPPRNINELDIEEIEPVSDREGPTGLNGFDFEQKDMVESAWLTPFGTLAATGNFVLNQDRLSLYRAGAGTLSWDSSFGAAAFTLGGATHQTTFGGSSNPYLLASPDVSGQVAAHIFGGPNAIVGRVEGSDLLAGVEAGGYGRWGVTDTSPRWDATVGDRLTDPALPLETSEFRLRPRLAWSDRGGWREVSLWGVAVEYDRRWQGRESVTYGGFGGERGATGESQPPTVVSEFNVYPSHTLRLEGSVQPLRLLAKKWSSFGNVRPLVLTLSSEFDVSDLSQSGYVRHPYRVEAGVAVPDIRNDSGGQQFIPRETSYSFGRPDPIRPDYYERLFRADWSLARVSSGLGDLIKWWPKTADFTENWLGTMLGGRDLDIRDRFDIRGSVGYVDVGEKGCPNNIRGLYGGLQLHFDGGRDDGSDRLIMGYNDPWFNGVSAPGHAFIDRKQDMGAPAVVAQVNQPFNLNQIIDMNSLRGENLYMILPNGTRLLVSDPNINWADFARAIGYSRDGYYTLDLLHFNNDDSYEIQMFDIAVGDVPLVPARMRDGSLTLNYSGNFNVDINFDDLVYYGRHVDSNLIWPLKRGVTVYAERYDAMRGVFVPIESGGVGPQIVKEFSPAERADGNDFFSWQDLGIEASGIYRIVYEGEGARFVPDGRRKVYTGPISFDIQTDPAVINRRSGMTLNSPALHVANANNLDLDELIDWDEVGRKPIYLYNAAYRTWVKWEGGKEIAWDKLVEMFNCPDCAADGKYVWFGISAFPEGHDVRWFPLALGNIPHGENLNVFGREVGDVANGDDIELRVPFSTEISLNQPIDLSDYVILSADLPDSSTPDAQQISLRVRGWELISQKDSTRHQTKYDWADVVSGEISLALPQFEADSVINCSDLGITKPGLYEITFRIIRQTPGAGQTEGDFVTTGLIKVVGDSAAALPPAQRIIEKPGRKTEYRIDEPVTLSDLIQFPDGVTNVWVYNWAATAASTEEYFQVDINASFYLKQAGIIGMGDWELVVTEDKENPSNNDVALAVSILPAQISLKSGYLASYTLGDPVDFGQIIQMPNELIVGRQEFQLFWKDGAGQWQAITPLIINYRASEFGITRPGTYHFTVSSSPEGTDPVEFDLTFTRK